ncbi:MULTISPECIES: hypothetical protein [unclassified Nostoc]|uniref:hypothetical protein n=1 Tax=unclassified Nostoc TaxID=2593658 RepID=UPI002AD3F0CB|nr:MULTISPECIES: hypothetical protein [unclassified Nostoc]
MEAPRAAASQWVFLFLSIALSATNEPLVDVAVASLNDTTVGDAREVLAIIAVETAIVKDSFENFLFIL